MTARATVVVVSWNGERWLRACLDALGEQTVTDFETWVVDNASADGSVALLEREYPHVRVLRNATNLGFAGGNNTALRQVTTPYAVLLNNDATPEPDWLEQLLSVLDTDGDVAAVTSKVLFAPRFLSLELTTASFRPGGADPRELGLRVYGLAVDGTDVTESVLWERLTYGPEGSGADRFRWTRPQGRLLVPVPDSSSGPWELTLRWAAEATKPVALAWESGRADLTVPAEGGTARTTVSADAALVDVVNNVGSVVFRDGYSADRGYQQVDEGQYDEACDVFALCGCAVAVRTDAGRAADWFDDDFFLYYEDTDLSWRLQRAGWRVRYEPRAVVRHVHAASSVEWSPTFVFHTDRNRLLLLTKNARAAVALREAGRYPLTTASMALRTLRQGLQSRSRPAVRPTLLRLRVMASYLRLLPAALARRARTERTAAVPRRALEHWFEERA
jgi:GT2 family glycosyltransferase